MKKIFITILTIILSVGCFVFITCGKTNKESKPTIQEDSFKQGFHMFNVKETNNYILKNGVTDYKIVIPTVADENEKFASSELLEFFKEATGVELEVVFDNDLSYTNDGKYISIGRNKLFLESGVIADASKLRHYGYRIATKGNTVFLVGGDTTYGTIYAVYEFLHQTLNYEFFGENTYTLNKNCKEIKLMDYDITDIPDIQIRVAGYGHLSNDVKSATRLRYRLFEDMFIPIGGNIWHNSFRYIDPNVYNNASNEENYHPEWFADDGTQLCYTAHGNEESLAEMTGIVEKTIQNALKEYPNREIVTITIEDTLTFCTCEECTKSKLKYNGSNAAVVVKFCNNVRKNIEAWFNTDAGKPYKRDLQILFFAYHETNVPPVVYDATNNTYKAVDDSVKCADGVNAFFAETNGDYTQSFYDESSVNAPIAKNMQGWRAISEKFYFWIYNTNFTKYLTPYNSFNAMQDNYRFAFECNTDYLFDQGQVDQSGDATGWSNLKIYLNSKLAWNVNEDMQKLIDRYFDAYYGEIADDIQSIFEDWRAFAVYQTEKMGYKGSNSIAFDVVKPSFWNKSLLKEWVNRFNKAIEKLEPMKVTDPEKYNLIYKHCAEERLAYTYLLVGAFSSELKDEEVATYKQMFNDDIRLVGITLESEYDKFVSDLLASWGL